MAEFIRRSYVEEHTEHKRSYKYTNTFGGLGFDCDENGNVNVAELKPAALENYNGVINGTIDVIDNGVETFTSRYRHPAVIKCVDCKAEVTLGNFTNTCCCGADYNNSGSRLAPREQWGEETGEHWTECY